MTRKQEAIYELNLLRAAINWPLVTEKKSEKMSYGVVLANIEAVRKEMAADGISAYSA